GKGAIVQPDQPGVRQAGVGRPDGGDHLRPPGQQLRQVGWVDGVMVGPDDSHVSVLSVVSRLLAGRVLPPGSARRAGPAQPQAPATWRLVALSGLNRLVTAIMRPFSS